MQSRLVKRAIAIYLLFALFATLIFARIVQLQWFQRQRWLQYRKHPRVYMKRLRATRGSILSTHNEILATTIPFYRIGFDPTVLDEHDYPNLEDSIKALCKALAHLSQQFQKDPRYTPNFFYQRIQKARKEQKPFIYLFPYKETFDIRAIKQLKTFPVLHRGRYKGGLILEKIHNKRFYPYGNLARITLGILKNDTLPLRGIEYSFHRYLRGIDGWQLVERVGNLEIPLADLDSQPPKDGYDVKTTINIHFQDIVHSALADAVRRHKAKAGVAVLMEVKTGKIRAIANYPENYNRAVALASEPGSTFKIASVIAALEEGIIRPHDTIHVFKGRYRYYDRIMHDIAPREVITFQEAFEHSSNIGISRVLYRYYEKQPQRFIQRLKAMGILEGAHCQLIGEPKPYIIEPSSKLWSAVTLPWLAIGYNVKLTPLQLLTFVNAIANNGRLIAPLLVEEIQENHRTIKKFFPKVIREKICSDSTLYYIRRFMEGVVLRGSARSIYDPNLPIAGKTGTARIAQASAGYEQKYIASFVGYFPAHQPRYSAIVVIYEPKERYYGGEVAAPVFKTIAQRIYSMDLRSAQAPELPKPDSLVRYPITSPILQENATNFYKSLRIPVQAQVASAYVRAHVAQQQVRYTPYYITRRLMPNVKGMNLRDALALLENLGLKVHLKGKGKVYKQSLPAGTPIQNGMHITLYLHEP